jgi:hypothetical protein
MAHAQRLFAAGANQVMPEAWEASMQLTEALLLDIGRDPAEVISTLKSSRAAYIEKLQEVSHPEPSDHSRRREGRRKGTGSDSAPIEMHHDTF